MQIENCHRHRNEALHVQCTRQDCHFHRYATLLFKKQRYVSGQHKVNLKIICKENYKYEVQEKSPANQAVTVQQLAEEYWRLYKH